MAAILAHLFRPVYQSILEKTKNKKGLSSAIACFLVAIIIVTPLIFVSVLVVNEVREVVKNVSGESPDFKSVIHQINAGFSQNPFLGNIKTETFLNQENIVSAVKSFYAVAVSVLQSTYRGIVQFIFATFIMFFSLFYLFIDGEKFVSLIMRLSPLHNKYENIDRHPDVLEIISYSGVSAKSIILSFILTYYFDRI